MGYWILVGMIVCGIALVIVVLAMRDAPRAGVEDNDRSGGSPASPNTRTSPNLDSPSSQPIGWLAFVPSHSGHRWPERIASGHSDVRLQLRPIADMTVERLASSLDPATDDETYGIVSFLVGLDDILSGMPRENFQERLDQLLDTVDRHSVIAVLGNVPDLSQLGLPGTTGLSEIDLRRVSEEWNATIADSARRHEADVIDLFNLPVPTPAVNVAYDIRDSGHLRGMEDALIARFAPAISAALERSRSDRAFNQSETPVDPERQG